MLNWNYFLITALFILGTIVGSFLNVVIFRIKAKQSFLKGRSYCPHCKKTLTARNLVPILSFIFQKGRCQYCKKEISLQYPLVEFATGFVFALVFWAAFRGLNFILPIPLQLNALSIIFYLFISSVLIIIFVYDLKHYIIPDKVVIPAIFITLAFVTSSIFLPKPTTFSFYLKTAQKLSLFPISIPWQIYPIASAFLGALILGGFFLTLSLISKGRWIGGGDIKLGILLGLVLGWPGTLIIFVIAYGLGAIVSITLIALGKKTRKDIIQFAPFLIFATLIAIFWGEFIINWYLNLIWY